MSGEPLQLQIFVTQFVRQCLKKKQLLKGLYLQKKRKKKRKESDLVILEQDKGKIIQKIFQKQLIFLTSLEERSKVKKVQDTIAAVIIEEDAFCYSIEEAKEKIKKKLESYGEETSFVLVLQNLEQKKYFKNQNCISEYHIVSNKFVKDKECIISSDYQTLFEKLKKNERYFSNIKQICEKKLGFVDGSQFYRNLCNIKAMLLPFDRQKAKKDFINLVEAGRSQENFKEKEIKKLIEEYPVQKRDYKSAFYWYCAQTFFFRIMNKGMRSLKKPEELLYFRLPFSDIFESIKQIYQSKFSQFFKNSSDSFICYRGAFFTNSELQKLKQSYQSFTYIQMQGFISTSYDKTVALNYLFNSGNCLMEIQVNKENLGGQFDYGFANVSQYSPWGESELLFNPGFFKIKSIEKVQQKYEYWPGRFQNKTITKISLEYGVQKLLRKKSSQLTNIQKQFIKLLEKFKSAKIENQGALFYEIKKQQASIKWFQRALVYEKEKNYSDFEENQKRYLYYIFINQLRLSRFKQAFATLHKFPNTLNILQNNLILFCIGWIYDYYFGKQNTALKYYNFVLQNLKKVSEIQNKKLLEQSIKERKRILQNLSQKEQKNENDVEFQEQIMRKYGNVNQGFFDKFLMNEIKKGNSQPDQVIFHKLDQIRKDLEIKKQSQLLALPQFQKQLLMFQIIKYRKENKKKLQQTLKQFAKYKLQKIVSPLEFTYLFVVLENAIAVKDYSLFQMIQIPIEYQLQVQQSERLFILMNYVLHQKYNSSILFLINGIVKIIRGKNVQTLVQKKQIKLESMNKYLYEKLKKKLDNYFSYCQQSQKYSQILEIQNFSKVKVKKSYHRLNVYKILIYKLHNLMEQMRVNNEYNQIFILVFYWAKIEQLKQKLEAMIKKTNNSMKKIYIQNLYKAVQQL